MLAVVFPSACPACGRLLARPGRGPLCEPCWASLPRHRAVACRCGLPLAPGLSACGRCRRGRQPFAAGASLGPYEGSLRVVLHELKYAGRRRVAGRLAEALLEEPAVRAARGDERRARAGAAPPAAAARAGLQPVRAPRRTRSPGARGRPRCPDALVRRARHGAPGRPLRRRAAAQRARGLRGAPQGLRGGADGGARGRRAHDGRDRARVRAAARGGGGERGAAADGGPGADADGGLLGRSSESHEATIGPSGCSPAVAVGRSSSPAAAGAQPGPPRGSRSGRERRRRARPPGHGRRPRSTPCPSSSRPSTRRTGWRCRRSRSSRSSPSGGRSGASWWIASSRSRSGSCRAPRPRSRRSSATRRRGSGGCPGSSRSPTRGSWRP